MPLPEAGASASAGLEPDTWVIHCDGSALPNPGRMGLGAVLAAPDGTRHTLSLATHAIGCNNEAELQALMAALDEVRARGATALQVYSDSSILVEQLGPEPASGPVRPVARLAPLFDEARRLLAGFGSVRLQWLPQRRNGEADALARAALGLPARPPSVPRRKKRR